MKTFFLALVLAVLASVRASAQVTVAIVLEQEQFLPSETVPVAVKITNRSGQPLHLGAEASWLTFDVESADGLIVVKNAEVPVTGEFDLNSSQTATKRVDLAPYFGLTRPGRYRMVATVRIKEWSKEMASPPKNFDVITGARIWAQDFGVPAPAGVTNAAFAIAVVRGGERRGGGAGVQGGEHREDGVVQQPGNAARSVVRPAHLVAERRIAFYLCGGEPGRRTVAAGSL